MRIQDKQQQLCKGLSSEERRDYPHEVPCVPHTVNCHEEQGDEERARGEDVRMAWGWDNLQSGAAFREASLPGPAMVGAVAPISVWGMTDRLRLQ